MLCNARLVLSRAHKSHLWIPGSATRPRNDDRWAVDFRHSGMAKPDPESRDGMAEVEPMEFAVEAQKLIGISLEGSVG